MEQENHNIGNRFREAFADFEQTPNPVVWKQLRRNLLLKKWLHLSYTRFAPVVGIALVVVLYFQYNIPSETQVLPTETSQEKVLAPQAQTIASVETKAIKDESTENQQPASGKVVKSPEQAPLKKIDAPVNQKATAATSHETRETTTEAQTVPTETTISQSKPATLATTPTKVIEKKTTPKASENHVKEPTPQPDLINPEPLISETSIQICLGEEVSLVAPEGWRYTWSTGDYARNIAVKPTETTTYEVTVENSDGVASVSRFNIEMLDCALYIPRAFSPNDDGSNDLFLVRGEGIVQFEIKLFSKWGELVFETRDMTQGWDGKLRGNRAPADAYIYQIHFTDETGKHHSAQGTVALIP